MYKITDNLVERAKKNQRADLTFWAVVLILFLVMFIIITFNTYVFFNVVVDGGSMKPTLQSGDVLVAKRTNTVKRGDIIVIEGEKKNEWLIKRAIAFGGETVEIKDGYVFIDGLLYEEDYLYSKQSTEAYEWQTRTLKQGEIFYLGDNRRNSADSRSGYGTCQENQVVGVVANWSLSLRWFNGALYDLGKIFRGGN